MTPTAKDRPYFSILIPTYNRLNFLKEALNSVFNQTFTGPYEVIVVDDGSQDGTWEFLENLAKTKDNLKILRHPENRGVASARNSALSLVKGEYILFLDSDDLLMDYTLERALATIETNEPRVVVASTYIKKNSKLKVKKLLDISDYEPTKRLKLFLDGHFSDTIYFFRKDIFRKFRFSENLKVREDWVLKGNIWATEIPAQIKNPLAIIKDHTDRLRKRYDLYLEATVLSVEYLFRELPAEFQSLKNYALSRAYIELGIKAFQGKNFIQAFEFYKKALERDPKIIKNFRFLKKFLKTYLLKTLQK
ncbi:MAG: glycosyltransferase, partial [Caldimicrobium sp.]|nr:glycosyltransferase [Caldimicrobium sp.]